MDIQLQEFCACFLCPASCCPASPRSRFGVGCLHSSEEVLYACTCLLVRTQGLTEGRFVRQVTSWGFHSASGVAEMGQVAALLLLALVGASSAIGVARSRWRPFESDPKVVRDPCEDALSLTSAVHIWPM